jgi:hypothetical protein
MARRVTRSAVALLVAALAASAALPAAAPAQHGNGLYEPFPEAAVRERAKRFVERLPFPPAAAKVRFGDDQLARGVFVGSPVPRSGPGVASARAGLRDGAGSGLSAVTQIALVLLAVVALPVLAGRRQRRRVAAA